MSKRSYLISLLLFLATTALQAQPITVWPGDANNNGIANHVDLLYIGLHYGDTGPARNTISTTWAPQALNTPWSGGGPAMPNIGYADCDGSGVIDSVDVFALQDNYGLIWGGVLPQDSGTLVTSGAPALILNIQDTVAVFGQTTVTMNIQLGDSITQLDSIFGVAFTITYDRFVIDNVLTAITGGWMNLDGNARVIQFVDTLNGRIEVAIVRTDGFAVNGSGSLGSLGIVMDDNIRVAANYELPFGVSFLRGMGPDGLNYYLQAHPDTLRAEITTSVQRPNPVPAIQVYPVPARDLLYLRGQGLANAHVRILDIRGVDMYSALIPELNIHQLSVADWPAGVYFLELSTPEGKARTKFCIGGRE